MPQTGENTHFGFQQVALGDKQARVNDERLFDAVNAPPTQTAPGAAITTWSFTCDVKLGETE